MCKPRAQHGRRQPQPPSQRQPQALTQQQPTAPTHAEPEAATGADPTAATGANPAATATQRMVDLWPLEAFKQVEAEATRLYSDATTEEQEAEANAALLGSMSSQLREAYGLPDAGAS